MGVIYRSQEVGRLALPLGDAHSRAAHAVLNMFDLDDGVASTTIHGSVTDGRANVRSDLDLLVIYQAKALDAEPEIVDNIKAGLDAVTDETNVKIEANLWPADEPLEARCERMYDRLFAYHLYCAMRDPKWSSGEPDRAIDQIVATPLTDVDIRKILFNYLTYKHSGFARAPRAYDDADRSSLLALQRTLELPKSIGRKAAQLAGDLHPNPSDGYKGNLGMCEADAEVIRALEELTIIDQYYTKLLEDIAEAPGSPSAHEIEYYEQWLQEAYAQALPQGIIAVSGFIRFLASKK